MSTKTLMLFATTHDVIKAERVCLKNGVTVQVVPVPRSISNECGMALEVSAENRAAVDKLFAESGVCPTHLVCTEEQ